jgi:hypothetical protein
VNPKWFETSSLGSIAQYLFSVCRNFMQPTSTRVNNYSYENKSSRQNIYFIVCRSTSLLNGFVECEEQGLQQQNEKNKQYEHLLRKYTECFPDADKNQFITKLHYLPTNFRKEMKRLKYSEKIVLEQKT